MPGSVRRGLNSVMKLADYSLPNPQSIFDKLEGSRFFTNLDIATSYWTVPISYIASSVRNTGNALSSMYQTILTSKNNGSRSEKSSKAESDILVFSKSSEEHLTHLQDVFKCSVRPENLMELQIYPGMGNYYRS